MTSCDTNILAYAYNEDVPEHERARSFLAKHLKDSEFAISEFALVEFYSLLRNPRVFPRALSPSDAVDLIQELRHNVYWRRVGGEIDASTSVWRVAATHGFPRRAIFDAWLAYSLAAEGVTRFATRNVVDFARFDAFEVFDPIAG